MGKTSANAASLQSALVRLQQWYTDWQHTINTKKCFVLHLGKTNSQIQYTVQYGCLIDIAQNVTDLGVDINCNLKYYTHINNIIGKAYARVGVLFKGFASCNLRILRQAFITYMRPCSSWICVKCLVAIFTLTYKCHWKSSKDIHQTYTTFVSPIIPRTSCSIKLRASWTS